MHKKIEKPQMSGPAQQSAASQSAASQSTTRHDALRIADERPAAVAQRRIQTLADASAASSRMRAWQSQSDAGTGTVQRHATAAPSGPGVRGTTVRQAHGPRPVVQRKEDLYDDHELAANRDQKQAEGIADTKLDAPLKHQRYRKLNRIAGELDRRSAAPHIGPVVSGLKGFFGYIESKADLVATTPPENTEIHDRSLAAVQDAAASGTATTAENFETYSLLGPLDYWLHNQASSADIATELHKLRLKMAERPGVSIVAHRGGGPTNRTRGGLIKDTDSRRLNRPAENSKAAFDAAYAETTRDATPRLDGIECDVYLSRDHVPMVSHDGNIREQLSTARRTLHAALVGDERHPAYVGDLDAAQLQTVQRTDSPDSAFITLDGLLNASVAVATTYYTATGHPLRIEVEMKGRPKNSRDPVAVAAYEKTIDSAVGKSISRFKKAHPQPYWEIILFNNLGTRASDFDAIRKRKSRLGHLYTGLGSNNPDTGRSVNADELRMAASTANLTAMKDVDDMIVTYVPGAERPYDTPKAQYGKLAFDPGQKKTYKDGVNRDMQDTTGEQATLIKQILRETRDSRNVHLLTDIPANAPKYKQYQQGTRDAAVLAASLNTKARPQMHQQWRTLNTTQKADVKALVLAERDKYPEVLRHIFSGL